MKTDRVGFLPPFSWASVFFFLKQKRGNLWEEGQRRKALLYQSACSSIMCVYSTKLYVEAPGLSHKVEETPERTYTSSESIHRTLGL